MKTDEDKEKAPEEKFFDGERYYTKEEFFNGDEEDGTEPTEPKASRKWIRNTVAAFIVVAFLSNILAFWPQVYNLAAIQFLAKSRELSQDENVQTYKESVVVVSTGESKGSGFNISAEGMIVTNHHVVEGEEWVRVRFPEGKSLIADVIATDPALDIAILQIRSEDQEFPILPLLLDKALEQGTLVYVIGNPLFFDYIANEGSILGEILLKDWDVPVMMIGAPIYKGNSGSPVINHDGKVVGIVFATTKTEIEGSKKKVGLAVPIHHIEELIDDIR